MRHTATNPEPERLIKFGVGSFRCFRLGRGGHVSFGAPQDSFQITHFGDRRKLDDQIQTSLLGDLHVKRGTID